MTEYEKKREDRLITNIVHLANLAKIKKQEEETGKKAEGKPILVSISKPNRENILDDLEFCGLTLNKGQSGEAYLVNYGGYWQLQPSYQGMVRAAKKCGLRSINVELVFEGEKFVQSGVVQRGCSPFIHEFDPLKVDRHFHEVGGIRKFRKPKGGYFCLETANGGFEYGVVPAHVFEDALKMTKGAFWQKFPLQMYLKTIVRWAMKLQLKEGEAGEQYNRIEELHEKTYVTNEEREAKMATVHYVEPAPKVEAGPKIDYSAAIADYKKKAAAFTKKEQFTELKMFLIAEDPIEVQSAVFPYMVQLLKKI